LKKKQVDKASGIFGVLKFRIEVSVEKWVDE